ncbi:MAG: alpha-ketoacid dehydrogenase subunit beta [Candidatus Latescibacter sp.]|nr:alpha-ketoacid dehydrogenase subunit beta [Candidatus Latescibacter sp.]
MPRKLLYREALNEAIREEMRRDDRVFILGQGIAVRGGSYGVTRTLLEEFGPGRVIDTPIAEASVTGMAVGAAIQGKRPIVEIMSIDFTTLALDMMVNQAAKYPFITGGKVPLVFRTQGGADHGLSIQHSQSLEAFFYHIPGLKVVMPSTPRDAKGLLKTAIRDDSPVVFIEHKLLYETEGEVPEEDYTIPFGEAALRREGTDCTLVSYSLMALKSLEAAEILAHEGISCDVLDLRTLVPLDRKAILDSVKKTGRLVVVNEAVKRGSVASDIAAFAAEEAFMYLKAPIMRVSGKITPIPYNAALENACVPDAGEIVAAVKKLMEYRSEP